MKARNKHGKYDAMKAVIAKVNYVIRYFIHLVLETFSLADKTDLFIDEKYYSIKIYYGRKCLDVGCGHGLTFQRKNAPLGLYTTTITAVSSAGLTWDLITPPNMFDKM